MSDLEGLAKTLLARGVPRETILQRIISEYEVYKTLSPTISRELAEAVLAECETSLERPADAIVRRLVELPAAQVSAGLQGVGCRGRGDFFVHKLIADLCATSVQAEVSPASLDDTGAVRITPADGSLVFSKMEGMHSRLSDFPFLAGFHVTRAALRDLYVKGARPISILVDIHLGDDADVGKLFDFMAGVAAVAELTGTPITGGSTLRIGGDMVVGTRITGGIGAVGVAPKGYFRRDIEVGDCIIMTEGAGGGTITTTGLYGGDPALVRETLNVKFLVAAQALLSDPECTALIHCMTDVTNGGLRGDLMEINHESQAGASVRVDRVASLVNPVVFRGLQARGIDYLGVSLDALLVFCPPAGRETILARLREAGVRAEVIGEVVAGSGIEFVDTGGAVSVEPSFRESAYTKVKQVIGEATPARVAEMEVALRQAATQAQAKRQWVVDLLREEHRRV
jgi:hydrogenase expression/formation protein